jgi:hypothetical protein
MKAMAAAMRQAALAGNRGQAPAIVAAVAAAAARPAAVG